MSSDFFETTIGDQLTLQRGFDITKKQQMSGHVPVVSSGGIASYHDEAKVRGPGVVLGRKGTLGTVFYIEEDYWPHDTSLWVKDFKGNNPRFVYYFFKSITPVIKKMDVGAANPALNRNHVHPMNVKWPIKKVQDYIVNILEKLDNKIELNRQTNQTLEQIAQALFKSWFVDFEPTRAKIFAKEAGASPEEIERAAMCTISGKTPDQLAQLPPETQQNLKTTAALFPDALVDSELGEVPEGWKVGTLANLCRLNESSWSEKNAPEEVNYVDLANTKNGIIEEVQRYSWSDAPSRARRILKAGDTIIGTVRPGNRSFSLIGTNEQVLTASTGFAVLSPKKKEYVELLYIASTSNESIDRLAHLADGGAYPAVRPDVVTQLEMVIPCDDLIEVFSELNRTVFTQMLDNLDENLTLKNLRDSLLPKLLSGEITLN